MTSAALGGLLPRKSSSPIELSGRGDGIGGAATSSKGPPSEGCTDTGRNPGVSTSVFSPDPVSPDPGLTGVKGVVPSADTERKYPGLPWLKEFAIVRGGSRLTRLPPALSCSSCRASSRLCAANASRGDSSGGTSPATCNLGDGRPLRDGDGRPFPNGPWDCDRRSMKLGLFAIV